VQIAGFVDLPIADSRVALPRMRDRVDDDTKSRFRSAEYVVVEANARAPSVAATHRFAITVPLSAGKRAPLEETGFEPSVPPSA
jgi:hypothetical protein